MKDNKFKTPIILGAITFMFISSIVSPIIFGQFNNMQEKNMTREYPNPNIFDCHHQSEFFHYKLKLYGATTHPTNSFHYQIIGQMEKKISSPTCTDEPMDSPWSIFCHDIRHTGRSQYNTTGNPGVEMWCYSIKGSIFSMAPSIDNNGIIYLPGSDLYAFYPNGTLKWRFDVPGGGLEFMCPAIDEDGTIYVGTFSPSTKYLLAINPDGTLKWAVQNGDMYSPPTIGNDGIIYLNQQYFDVGSILAFYPNGTLKWKYYTSNSPMYSSPAIDNEGTIYCGSHDHYLYALYPNGTLKWKFNTGDIVHGSPTIGNDGTIYIGTDSSIYSLYPSNGTAKWRRSCGGIWGASALDKEGILYVGDWDGKFYAIYPNGTLKWTYQAPGHIWFSSAALSADGNLYFGTIPFDDWAVGRFIALNREGKEIWNIGGDKNEEFSCEPVIDKNGTVYIASQLDSDWCFHAFGPLDPNVPTAPTIIGQTNGRIKRTYDYTFTSTSLLGNQIYYLIDWGDGTTTDWLGPYDSGETMTMSHSWSVKGTYNITARAKDTDNRWGPWGTLTVTMPTSYSMPFLSFWMKIFTRFPNAFPMFRYLLGFNQ